MSKLDMPKAMLIFSVLRCWHGSMEVTRIQYLPKKPNVSLNEPGLPCVRYLHVEYHVWHQCHAAKADLNASGV